MDDSAVIRGMMTKALSQDIAIEIVGSAANGEMALGMVGKVNPDVIILDIEMPVMDGLTALPLLLKASPGSKIIMSSAITRTNASLNFKAMDLGATDYLTKPSSRSGDEVDDFFRQMIEKVKALGGIEKSSVASIAPNPVAIAKPSTASITLAANSSTPLHVTGVKALAIASSTGGPQALMVLFESLKGRLLNIPIFITQHMPPTFTTILAEHITKIAGRNCIEVKGGEVPVPGNIYLAPGDFHMLLEKNGSQPTIHITKDPPENFCRPAADPMLRSLSKIYGRNLAVVVLTGMGQDGMLGSRIVVENGGNVIAQDEASCVVYGMPKAVVENKLCKAVLPLSAIGRYLIQQIEAR